MLYLPPRPVDAQERPDTRSPGDSSFTVPATAAGQPHGMKSGTTAFLCSFLATTVPAVAAGLEVWEGSSDSKVPGAIFVGAAVLGPSAGHFYSGRPGRALSGIGLRVLTGAGVAAALLSEDSESGDNSLEGLGIASAVLGGAVVVWDIVDAPHSARVHNKRVRRGRVDLGFIPSPDGPAAGLRVDFAW